MKLRKGFTLVELLIVIAILGALASMMSLSGTGATASAKASTIVNNLITMKRAMQMFYSDYVDSGDWSFSAESFINVSTDYLDNSTIKALEDRYSFAVSSNASGAKGWFVGYAFDTTATDTDQIRKNLLSRKKLGLLEGSVAKDATSLTVPSTANFSTELTATSRGVWLKVR